MSCKRSAEPMQLRTFGANASPDQNEMRPATPVDECGLGSVMLLLSVQIRVPI
ncbi:predicted protein [Coccidioides posadasii str. Silveira]|uniref:Predicted protein n=1 Tax=Coccidioides posadasii (strain RMSCC 757 / Silveira) TaxID=443226 RepID=E9CVE2_COCPS|nr:predicted protein [Coccidioides posadasii str. Silveira]